MTTMHELLTACRMKGVDGARPGQVMLRVIVVHNATAGLLYRSCQFCGVSPSFIWEHGGFILAAHLFRVRAVAPDHRGGTTTPSPRL
jgi:hypothetical protein